MKMLFQILVAIVGVGVVYALYLSTNDFLKLKEQVGELTKLHDSEYKEFREKLKQIQNELSLSTTPARLSLLQDQVGDLYDKVKTAETIAHSAKMDAIRIKDQKITINVPPIKVVHVNRTAKLKTKKENATQPTKLDVDNKIIKDIKKKLKEVSQ